MDDTTVDYLEAPSGAGEGAANFSIKQQRLESPFGNSAKATESQKPEKREVPVVRQQRAKMMEDHVKQYSEGLLKDLDPTAAAEAKERVEKVRSYFTTVDERIGMTPYERMAQTYEYLDKTRTSFKDQGRTDIAPDEEFHQALERHSFELSERAFDQHMENPEQYVSHGFDHSINVTNNIRDIAECFPEIVSTIAKDYAIPPEDAKFLLENAALFHDCGYCKLAKGNSKAVHSLTSLRIIGNHDFQKTFPALLSGEAKDMGKLLYDLEGAVLYHNADKIEQKYDAKVQTTKGEYLGLAQEESFMRVISHYEELSQMPEFDWINISNLKIQVKDQQTASKIESQLKEAFTARGFDTSSMPSIEVDESLGGNFYYGRAIDLAPGDKLAGLEYKPADTLEYSLLSSLRISDNMDLLPNRFSDIQRTEAFQDIYRAFGVEGQVHSVLSALEDKSVPLATTETQFAAFIAEKKAQGSGQNIEQLEQQFNQTKSIGDEAQRRKELQTMWKGYVVDDILGKYTGLSAETKEKLTQIGVLQSTESFRHFGGCEGLRSIALEPSREDPSEVQLSLTINKAVYDELMQHTVVEKALDPDGNMYEVEVPVAQYQIWRLYDAIQVNKHNQKAIQIRLYDEKGAEIDEPEFMKAEQRAEAYV